MKTLINTVLKSSLIAIILLASIFSLNASAATITKDSTHIDIKKVVVTGNAHVLLVQNTSESVKVDELDRNKVMLRQVGSTLTINSVEKHPVTVVVYVKDLYRIDASDFANVRTSGKFNVKALQIMLKDDAKARVKASTESLYTVVDGRANLELLGNSDNHISKMDGLAKVDINKFAAKKTEDVNTMAVAAVLTSNDKQAFLSK